MELEKQRLLIEYLVSSQELIIKTLPILQTKYFDPKIKNVVTFIKEYFDEYKIAPTTEQISAETGQKVEIKTSLTRQELTYAENQLERFCREKAIEHAIMASPMLLEEGKYGEIEKLIKEAITVGLTRNIGLDYFSDPEARLRLLSLNNSISTGWWKLNEYLGGGLNRKEMIIFAAPPGIGKSLTMGNLAKNLLKQHLNGAFITLELAEEVVAKRFDSMFSGMHQLELMKNITEASIKITRQKEHHGAMHIKRMPESSTNANHIRAYLKEFEIVNGYLPDFIVVDYLDLMCSVQQISAENTFIRDKFISEELRSIANDFNLIMITASQLNRCLSVDSIINTPKGNVKLLDIKLGDLVKSREGFNIVVAKSEIIKQQVFKIKTKSGKEIILSKLHTMPANFDFLIEKSILSGLVIGDKIFIDEIMWDEIIEIEDIGEMDTLDIEVSGDHLFFANDVLVHNSALQVENIEDIGQANIAGGISKINTTDNLIAIIQSPQMKARGEMMFKLLKTRSSNGVGNFYMLKFNQKNLCLENQEEDPGQARLTKTIGSYIKNKGNDDLNDPKTKTALPKDLPKSSKLDITNLPFQV